MVRSVRTSLYTMPQVTIHHNHCRKRRVRSVENSADGKLDHRRHCHSWRIREFHHRKFAQRQYRHSWTIREFHHRTVRSQAVSPLVENQRIPPLDSSVTGSITTRGESGNSTTGQFGQRRYRHSWRIRDFHQRQLILLQTFSILQNPRLVFHNRQVSKIQMFPRVANLLRCIHCWLSLADSLCGVCENTRKGCKHHQNTCIFFSPPPAAISTDGNI